MMTWHQLKNFPQLIFAGTNPAASRSGTRTRSRCLCGTTSSSSAAPRRRRNRKAYMRATYSQCIFTNIFTSDHHRHRGIRPPRVHAELPSLLRTLDQSLYTNFESLLSPHRHLRRQTGMMSRQTWKIEPLKNGTMQCDIEEHILISFMT